MAPGQSNPSSFTLISKRFDITALNSLRAPRQLINPHYGDQQEVYSSGSSKFARKFCTFSINDAGTKNSVNCRGSSGVGAGWLPDVPVIMIGRFRDGHHTA